jgi:hypothetical protein
MASVYRVACSACEYRSARFPGARLAVLVPDPLEDTANGTVLLHPLAPFVLEEFDLSFPQAAWGGHLVAARSVVCIDCGRVAEQQKLTGGGVGIGCGGWLIVFAAGVVAAGITAYLAENPFIGLGVAGVGAVLALAVIELGAGVIVRARYRNRARAVAGNGRCAGCGSYRRVRVDQCNDTFPCPACEQPECRVQRAT